MVISCEIMAKCLPKNNVYGVEPGLPLIISSFWELQKEIQPFSGTTFTAVSELDCCYSIHKKLCSPLTKKVQSSFGGSVAQSRMTTNQF